LRKHVKKAIGKYFRKAEDFRLKAEKEKIQTVLKKGNVT